MDSMRRNAQKMMPHIMAMNKDPNVGMKNNRQPKPGVSNLTAYAKGGKVMAKGGAADKKQDKSMLARHNRLMHPGQKSKLMNGGMVKKYADGGKTNPLALKFEKERDEPVKSLKQEDYDKTIKSFQNKQNKELPTKGMTYSDEEIKSGKSQRYKDLMNQKRQYQKDNAENERANPEKYAKGGKVKCSPKKKGDKKKVMGTVGEAKTLMAALQKARRPATPMPGTRMAGLGMAPPMAPQMAPPMKKGGKVMKKAAGGAAKLRKS
jgi:hypothetical protein